MDLPCTRARHCRPPVRSVPLGHTQRMQRVAVIGCGDSEKATIGMSQAVEMVRPRALHRSSPKILPSGSFIVYRLSSIVYRRLTMNDEGAEPLDRAVAAEYASWFRALADATRVQIVSLLARRGEPMSVGAITAAVEVGQSTVSAHLKVLAEVGFVLAERRGTAVFYRVNQACVECFPTAADLVMGRPVPRAPSC
jgi:DNA-binding transcriptional ArsR family regulator